ncbi:hypothetical protein D3C78_902170 [compost metagenome]
MAVALVGGWQDDLGGYQVCLRELVGDDLHLGRSEVRGAGQRGVAAPFIGHHVANVVFPGRGAGQHRAEQQQADGIGYPYPPGSIFVVADRLLDEPVGRHCQCYRQGDDQQALQRIQAVGAQVFQGECQQRPVPQIDAEGNLAEPCQVPIGQPAAGNRWFRAAAGDDQHDGGSDWNQRDVTGELAALRSQQAEQQQCGQAEQTEQVAQPHRQTNAWKQQGEQRATEELPDPCRRVEVAGHRIPAGLDDRVEQGRHGYQADTQQQRLV